MGGPEATAAQSDPGVWHLLAAAGVLDRPTPASLLATPDGRALTLEKRLDELATDDAHRLDHTAAELACLGNVLLAAIELSGSISRRQDQARGLAFATANPGVELLEAQGLPVVLGEPPWHGISTPGAGCAQRCWGVFERWTRPLSMLDSRRRGSGGPALARLRYQRLPGRRPPGHPTAALPNSCWTG